MINTFGADWELAQAPTFPIDMRVVNDAGQEVGRLVFCLLWRSALLCYESAWSVVGVQIGLWGVLYRRVQRSC